MAEGLHSAQRSVGEALMSKAWEELKITLAELGIEPKRSLGQNFLVSDAVIEKIIRAASAPAMKQTSQGPWEQVPPAAVLEIGPGPGALTRGLRQLGLPLTLIELDRRIAQHWRDQGLTVIEEDALQLDWTKLDLPSPRYLVSNLPYQISASLVIERSMDAKPFERMVLMFQKEVAQKIRATVEQGDYGMLSVVAQTFWKIETVTDAGSADFFPPPKVSSRVLQFVPKPSPVGESGEERKHFLQFVKACFLHPRKLMVSNLQEGFAMPKEKTLQIFAELGIGEKVRAEQLKLTEFHQLFQRMR
jgi:16S rRNA (adenine1518-N6/adenine1519-N6)-dimethyltransferase